MTIIRPITGQANLLRDFKSTVLAAIAGTGGGKTALGYWWLHSRMEAFPGCGWLVSEPTYPMLSKILLNSPDPSRPDIIRYFESVGHHPKYEAVAKILKTDFGQIYLGSTDNPDSMQGMAVKGCWLDEPGMMVLAAYQTALQRTSMQSGQVLLTTTPYNMGWLKTEVYDKASDTIHVETWRSIDRPGFPLDKYEEMKRTLSPSRFAMMFDGKFERPEGLIYADFEESRHVVNYSPYPAACRVVAGLDWGYSNPGVIEVIAETPDKQAIIVHEEYHNGMTVDQWAVLAKDLKRTFRIESFYCDPAEPQDIEFFKRAGLNALAAENAVVPGINKVIEGWRTDKLKISQDAAPHLLEELGVYHWSDNKIKEQPVKESDHACDALRYGIMGLAMGRTPTNIQGLKQESRFR